ncbi:hypothetical protein X975_12468, partial [Stegodyphus mimosarum]
MARYKVRSLEVAKKLRKSRAVTATAVASNADVQVT